MSENNFYKTATLSTLPDIQHRHFRCRVGTEWVKLPRMHSINELKTFLTALEPDAVYQSVSTWLNPGLLACRDINKAGYPILANCLLSSDFLADFDAESTANDLIEASRYLKEAGFNTLRYVITGRGAHIWVLDFYQKRCTKTIANPKNRIKYVQAQRKKLADELVKAGVIFDDKISADPYRVARLWGSLHDDGKTVCNMYNNFMPFITNYSMTHALRHSDRLSEGGIQTTTHEGTPYEP